MTAPNTDDDGLMDDGYAPTYVCEDCGLGVRDSGLFSDISRANNPSDVWDALRGAECPHCGHIQDP